MSLFLAQPSSRTRTGSENEKTAINQNSSYVQCFTSVQPKPADLYINRRHFNCTNMFKHYIMWSQKRIKHKVRQTGIIYKLLPKDTSKSFSILRRIEMWPCLLTGKSRDQGYLLSQPFVNTDLSVQGFKHSLRQATFGQGCSFSKVTSPAVW